MDLLHWSRACGTGVGLSSHTNEYRNGVRIGNWLEESKELEDKQRTSRVLSHGEEFKFSTAYAEEFKPPGLGSGGIVQREVNSCLAKEQLFPHGDLLPPLLQCHATVNQLVFQGSAGGDGNPLRVQDCIWSADKTINSKVPLSTQARAAERKSSGHGHENRYLSASKGVYLETALKAAGSCVMRSPSRTLRDR